jgi:hypothetical protein
MIPRNTCAAVLAVLAAATTLGAEGTAGGGAQAAPPPAADRPELALPYYLKDRGTGVATSMFGTYIRRGELIVYPYWEGYLDNDREYNPEELGYTGQEDFRGRYRESEYLFFAAYGISDRFAVQAEVAIAKASLEKSPADTSGLPPRLEESGLTSFETQLRWRWLEENEGRPELWSYLDVVYPTNRSEPLIGTTGLESELGVGLTRGYRWGTLTGRVALAYEGASSTKWDLGEYAVEYLKRLSPSWRLFLAMQGQGDELSLVTEAQWHLSGRVFVRFNQEIGLSSRATDWEPQLGILFTLPTRRTPR